MLEAIHHMALNAGDYDRAKDFYVNKLGFQILGEYVFPNETKRLDCRLGSAQLEIFWSAQYGPRPEGKREGYRHLAFRVDDARAAAQWLRQRGIEVTPVQPDIMAGGQMAFFYDPDGLELEIHEG